MGAKTEEVVSEDQSKMIVPDQRHELGNELELWLVDIFLLQEQDLNARAMAPDMFNQLSTTIGKQGRLESMPFCAYTPATGLEIISGHHRVRAARKAEVLKLWVLVDVSGMSRDAVRAKQLAHNSINGRDDADLVRQIYNMIEDVDTRLEAYIDFDADSLKGIDVTLTSKELEIDFDTKQVVLVFLPAQLNVLKQALTLLEADATAKDADIYLATKEEYTTLVALLGAAGEAFNITSTPTIFARMGELVIEHLDKTAEAKPEQE